MLLYINFELSEWQVLLVKLSASEILLTIVVGGITSEVVRAGY